MPYFTDAINLSVNLMHCSAEAFADYFSFRFVGESKSD